MTFIHTAFQNALDGERTGESTYIRPVAPQYTSTVTTADPYVTKTVEKALALKRGPFVKIPSEPEAFIAWFDR